jgi:hypothetical protein
MSIFDRHSPDPYAPIIARMLYQILLNTETIMSQGTSAAQALTDLQAAQTSIATQLAALGTALTQLTTDVTTGIATLTQLLQNPQGVDPTAVEAVVAQLQASVTAAQTAAASISTLDASVVAAEAAGGAPPPQAKS